MASNILIYLLCHLACYQPQNLIPKTIGRTKTKPGSHSQANILDTQIQIQSNVNLFSIFVICHFKNVLLLYEWNHSIPLGIFFKFFIPYNYLEFIQVVVHVSSLGFCGFLNIPWMYHGLFTYLPTEEHLSCFHFFGYYDQNCYKHLGSHICINLNLHFLRSKNQECNCWVI